MKITVVTNLSGDVDIYFDIITGGLILQQSMVVLESLSEMKFFGASRKKMNSRRTDCFSISSRTFWQQKGNNEGSSENSFESDVTKDWIVRYSGSCIRKDAAPFITEGW